MVQAKLSCSRFAKVKILVIVRRKVGELTVIEAMDCQVKVPAVDQMSGMTRSDIQEFSIFNGNDQQPSLNIMKMSILFNFSRNLDTVQ